MTDRRVSDERAAELAQLIALVRTSIGSRGSDPGAVDQLAAWMLSYGEGLLEDRAADRAEIERLVEELDVRKAQIDGALAQLDRGERKRIEALRLLREAADEIIDLAESLHEAGGPRWKGPTPPRPRPTPTPPCWPVTRPCRRATCRGRWTCPTSAMPTICCHR